MNERNETLQTLDVLSVAFGAPCVHHIVLKELNTMSDPASLLMRDTLKEYVLNCKMPMREFPTEYGPLVTMISTRSDLGLCSEGINVMPGTKYKQDDPKLILHEQVTSGPLVELFQYISFYVYKRMPEVEPELYNALLEVFDATKIIPLPMERILDQEDCQTKKLVMALAFERKEGEPIISKYCISPYLKDC